MAKKKSNVMWLSRDDKRANNAEYALWRIKPTLDVGDTLWLCDGDHMMADYEPRMWHHIRPGLVVKPGTCRKVKCGPTKNGTKMEWAGTTIIKREKDNE